MIEGAVAKLLANRLRFLKSTLKPKIDQLKQNIYIQQWQLRNIIEVQK